MTALTGVFNSVIILESDECVGVNARSKGMGTPKRGGIESWRGGGECKGRRAKKGNGRNHTGKRKEKANGVEGTYVRYKKRRVVCGT